MGFQIFRGYRFGKVANNLSLDAEVGYMDTGDMDMQYPVLPGVMKK